jgi:hypothetical protein
LEETAVGVAAEQEGEPGEGGSEPAACGLAPAPQPAQADLYRHLRDNPAEINPAREDPGREVGDVDKAAANADYVTQAEYTAAYIAHVPL